MKFEIDMISHGLLGTIAPIFAPASVPRAGSTPGAVRALDESGERGAEEAWPRTASQWRARGRSRACVPSLRFGLCFRRLGSLCGVGHFERHLLGGVIAILNVEFLKNYKRKAQTRCE